MASSKVSQAVTPAKAGVQKASQCLDSRLRGNDRKGRFLIFCDIVNLDGFEKRQSLLLFMVRYPFDRLRAVSKIEPLTMKRLQILTIV
jgi:hypothetical protein